MIIDMITQDEWLIPDHLKEKFSAKTLRKILYSFNQMNGGGYFFADYYHQKLIVDSSESRVLCGYPKGFATTEGLDFFRRILKKKEIFWQKKIQQLVAHIFFNLDDEERQHLMLLYDMPVRQKDGKKQTLNFKIIPFQLCENGNLWLALGCVSPAITQGAEHQVCLVNMPALTRYDLIDNEFIASEILPLTIEEREILLLLVKNMLESGICKQLNMDKYKYHRLKTSLFEKLEVDTPASAVQRAHHLGLI